MCTGFLVGQVDIWECLEAKRGLTKVDMQCIVAIAVLSSCFNLQDVAHMLVSVCHFADVICLREPGNLRNTAMAITIHNIPEGFRDGVRQCFLWTWTWESFF